MSPKILKNFSFILCLIKQTKVKSLFHLYFLSRFTSPQKWSPKYVVFDSRNACTKKQNFHLNIIVSQKMNLILRVDSKITTSKQDSCAFDYNFLHVLSLLFQLFSKKTGFSKIYYLCLHKTNRFPKQPFIFRDYQVVYTFFQISTINSLPAAKSAAKSLQSCRLCATSQMAAHQAPLSLGFSRQEHWSGLPFPSPMHKSEK